jgi:hypothetical protein
MSRLHRLSSGQQVEKHRSCEECPETRLQTTVTFLSSISRDPVILGKAALICTPHLVYFPIPEQDKSFARNRFQCFMHRPRLSVGPPDAVARFGAPVLLFLRSSRSDQSDRANGGSGRVTKLSHQGRIAEVVGNRSLNRARGRNGPPRKPDGKGHPDRARLFCQ